MRYLIRLTTLAIVIGLTAAIAGVTQAQVPDLNWTGQYYNNPVLDGAPALTRTDPRIAFNWGDGNPQNISADQFSVRWTANGFFEAGTYRFWVFADENIELRVDGRTILNTYDTRNVAQIVSADVTLESGLHRILVNFREVYGRAFAYVDYANMVTNPAGPNFPANAPAPGSTPLDPIDDGVSGIWVAEYFTNPDLLGSPALVRRETLISNDWGTGSPDPAIPADRWSARWTADLRLSGAYRFSADADDGIRVRVDGRTLIDEWHVAEIETYSVTERFAEDTYRVVVEYYESGGEASVQFGIERLGSMDGQATARVITGRLNVRDEPSAITGEVLTKISLGDTYPATARNADATWVQINVNGIVGWVNSTYINVTNLLDLPVQGSTPITPAPTGYTVKATPYTVNIRSGPSTTFRDLGNLPDGETARVIGRNAAGTWWQINYNDIVGWVSAQYAIIEAGADLNQIPITE